MIDNYEDVERFKEIMETVATQVVDRERPKYRFARVGTWDDDTGRAVVFYPDAPDEPVGVAMGAIRPTEAQQWVRVAGLPGDPYIDDVMYGMTDSVDDPHIPPDGTSVAHWKWRGHWVTATEYRNNDIVTARGFMWRATTSHESGVYFDPANWTKVIGQTQPPPTVGSLRFVGHSLLDVGDITEQGKGRPFFPGRVMQMLGVDANRVTNDSVIGSSARFGSWIALQGINPGPMAWPRSADMGLGVLWWGANDTRYGVATGGWEEYSFKAAYKATIARMRAGSVYESNHTPTTSYSGSGWTTVTHASESSSYSAGSGTGYNKTTTVNDKVVITTPEDMGRYVSGVWVNIGLIGGDTGAEVEIWLDGVLHGDVDTGMGAASGTAFAHGLGTSISYRTNIIYRLWVPTVQAEGNDYTEPHTIEVIMKGTVGASSVGLLYDYWSIDADDAPLIACMNVLQPSDPNAISGYMSDPTVHDVYNGWIRDVIEEFVLEDGSQDPRVRYVDVDTPFLGDSATWVAHVNDKFYVTDHLHLSEYGAKIAADALFDEIVASLSEGVTRNDLMGLWRSEYDPLMDPPSWFISDGIPIAPYDTFESGESEDSIGALWDEQVGACGIDFQGQGYMVRSLFPHWVMRDDVTRDDSASLGTVEYDTASQSSRRAWSVVNGTFAVVSNKIAITAKAGAGHNVVALALNSMTQNMSAQLANGNLGVYVGIILRYDSASNSYLLVGFNGFFSYVCKVIAGTLTVINILSSVGSRPYAEIGSDDVLRVWNEADGAKDAYEYTVVDAALQYATGTANDVGLWVSSSAPTPLTQTFDKIKVGNTLAATAAQNGGDGASPQLTIASHDFGDSEGCIGIELGGYVSDYYSQLQGSGMIYRQVDEENYYLFYSTLFGFWYLYKVVANARTLLAEWWCGYGSGLTIAVEFKGSTHKVYKDGVLVTRSDGGGTSATDGTHTGTRHGFAFPYTTVVCESRWRKFLWGQVPSLLGVPRRGDMLIDTSEDTSRRLVGPYQKDGSWGTPFDMQPPVIYGGSL